MRWKRTGVCTVPEDSTEGFDMKKIICFILVFVLAVSCFEALKPFTVCAESEAVATAEAETEEEDSSSFSKALGKRILISSLIILPIAIFLGIRSGNKKYGKG